MSKLFVVKLPDHKISSETKSFVPSPITEIESKFSFLFLKDFPKIQAVKTTAIPIMIEETILLSSKYFVLMINFVFRYVKLMTITSVKCFYYFLFSEKNRIIKSAHSFAKTPSITSVFG